MSRGFAINSQRSRLILSLKVRRGLSQREASVLTDREARHQSWNGTFPRYNPFPGTLKESTQKEVRP